jgi:farnesyl-diphosphate farnesyltransferase
VTKHRSSPAEAERYQARALPKVSRTFALTIPQLPVPLRSTVSNAYLLCRIADTIEDEASLDPEKKREMHHRFVAIVNEREPVTRFAVDLRKLLTESATSDELELVENTERVVALTHSFPQRQKIALQKCVSIMCSGMPDFQGEGHENGLASMHDLDRYCYFVAGVVGEMLTELFCDHSKDIDKHYDRLMHLAPSFGQGLQMTNILKDIWEDMKRTMCWLPAEVFRRVGYDNRNLKDELRSPEFVNGIRQLIRIANSHLHNALDYTLLIPKNHIGIRRFCLWGLGFAVLTLRKINRNPVFSSSQDVKVTRTTVKRTILIANMMVQWDSMLRTLFKQASKGLNPDPGGLGEWTPDYASITQWVQPDTNLATPTVAIEQQG